MSNKIAACFLGAALAAGLSMGPSQGAVRPYVFGGGQQIYSEKQELDKLLDEYTIHDDTRSWEGGAGLRLFSRFNVDGTPRVGDPRWEIRLHFGLGAGDLTGTTISGRRFVDRNSFAFTSKETFSYSSWAFGASFVAQVLPRAGFFLGPMLQSVHYKGARAWTGPSGCYQCGEGQDKSTVRYGLVEIGTRWRPLSWPLNLEGYWIPKRVELSTTHILKSADYKANFPSFSKSFGVRVAYDL